MSRFFRILYLLLWAASVLAAQTPQKRSPAFILDSLHHLLKIQKEDTNRVFTLNLLSEKYWRISRYDTAMLYANDARELAGRIVYKKGMEGAYRNMGVIYFQQGNYDKSLDADLKAQSIAIEIGDQNGVAIVLGNIGLIYYSQGSYKKALDCQQKALTMHLALHAKKGVANCYGNMGTLYKAMGDYSKALEYYSKSLALHEETGNKNGIVNNLGNIGTIYQIQGNTAKAMEYDQKSLSLARELGFSYGIGNALINIGNMLVTSHDYKKAKLLLDSALQLSNRTGEKEITKSAYFQLCLLDSMNHDFKAGLADYKMYVVYKDSLNNEVATQRTVQTEMNFEFEQKQLAQKAEQDKQRILAERDKEKQLVVRNGFIVAFLLICVVVLLLYGRSRTKERTTRLLREQNRLINERNAELERLSIVARETDNLILILGPDGTVEWANESFSRLNGITIEELKKLKGNTIYEISNNPDIKSIIHKAVSEKRPVVYESLNLNNEGKRTWESSTLTPTFDENGKLKKLIIVDTNITQRKLDEEIIQEINKDITDSIHYAKRLQDAIMPPLGEIRQYFPESFVFYKPKAIVAGDFYWMHTMKDTVLIAAADCTGHGVPGALVSVVCSNALNRAVKEFGITEPGKILDKVRELVLETFQKSESTVQDGMDISFCCITPGKDKYTISWSGANNPLWYIQNGKMLEVQAQKQPIGRHDHPAPFTTHTLTLQKGDILYLFTDGYADQFGGAKGKKFMYRQLQDFLLAIASSPMNDQQIKLEDKLREWKGNLEQVDDILIIGIRT